MNNAELKTKTAFELAALLELKQATKQEVLDVLNARASRGKTPRLPSRALFQHLTGHAMPNTTVLTPDQLARATKKLEITDQSTTPPASTSTQSQQATQTKAKAPAKSASKPATSNQPKDYSKLPTAMLKNMLIRARRPEVIAQIEALLTERGEPVSQSSDVDNATPVDTTPADSTDALAAIAQALGADDKQAAAFLAKWNNAGKSV